MYRKWVVTGVVASVLSMAAVTISCANDKAEDGAVVRIGSKVISMPSFESFRKMQRMYPTRLPELFPGNRGDITFLVETEIVYDEASPVIGSHRALEEPDWKWKSKFFPAQLYLTDVLQEMMGVTEKEIEDYYAKNVQEFKDTVTDYKKIKVKAADGDTAVDSAGMKDSTIAKDSIFVRSLAEVRNRVIEKVFLKKYPPAKEFVDSRLEEDSTLSEERIDRMWVNHARRTLPEFFMKIYYEERFGTPFPDSLDPWYGEGKLITPDDMEVILSWLPEQQREMYRDEPQRVEDLAQWLLIWELLSEKAKEQKYTEEPDVRRVLEWAKKVQVAAYHVEHELAKKVAKGTTVDTSMARFAYWDGISRVQIPLDSARFQSRLEELQRDLIGLGVDSIIHQERKKAKVEFLQSDFTDQRDKNPAEMLSAADAARDTGNVRAAEDLYRSVTTNFAFLPEGRTALGELAKLLTENERYNDAIRQYRRRLLWYPQDQEEKCNTFFMIGFIYDEYLNKTELAEVNYRWLLKNTPDCELADDAEFMALHLDEPMTSVEELRGEAERQGRDVDEPSEEEVQE